MFSRTSGWPCNRAATPSRSSTSYSGTPPPRRAVADGARSSPRAASDRLAGAPLARAEPRAHRRRRGVSGGAAHQGIAQPVLGHGSLPGLRRPAELRAAAPAGGADHGRGEHRGLGDGHRRGHPPDVAGARAVPRQELPGSAAGPLGAHRAVGGVGDHDLEALRVDLRLLLRNSQPGAPVARRHRPPGGLARRRLDRDGRDGHGGNLRVATVHDVRLARRAPGDPAGRVRGGASRRRLGVADVLVGDVPVAAAGPAGRRRAEHHLRLQLVSDRVDAQRPQPRLRARHDDHVHVQDRVQELAPRRRARRGARRGQRPAHPSGRAPIPPQRALASAGGLMAVAIVDPGARGALRRARLACAGLLVALVFTAPYGVMLFTAAKPAGELRASPPRLTPVDWHWSTFVEVLRDPGFQSWLGVSLTVALASTAVVVLAAVPAAYYTARHRFRGRTAFLFLVLVTQMFSPTTLVVGLHREFFELILTNTAFNLAFAIWILRAFFASIPREIEDAAAIDGCGRLRVLVRIVLPLSLPGVVTA